MPSVLGCCAEPVEVEATAVEAWATVCASAGTGTEVSSATEICVNWLIASGISLFIIGSKSTAVSGRTPWQGKEIMRPLQFEVEAEVRNAEGLVTARAGKLTLRLPDGSPYVVETPTFMPVGTYGTVKAMLPSELEDLGSQIILGNTYHLYLRPGHERIARLGGLHQFMNWKRPILTDSGGFQVFSLSKFRKITDHGATFQSHIDGSKHEFTPELSMEVQRALHSTIVMAFDECPPYPATPEQVLSAMKRTYSWAQRGLDVSLGETQSRFGIIQGGLYPDLREQSLQEITSLPFDGFAIGGLSIGESPELMQAMTRHIAPKMPRNKPRYLMGVGRPADLVECTLAGVDMFDCVMPTRNARNGQLFTSFGKINIKNEIYKDDANPLDPATPTRASRDYSRAYLRHLFMQKELLSARLNTEHNLGYYLQLTRDLRQSIIDNKTDEFRRDFYGRQGLPVPDHAPLPPRS